MYRLGPAYGRAAQQENLHDVLSFSIGSGGSVELEVETLAVSASRGDIPALMRRSAETGRGFIIQNAKTQAGPAALLVDVGVLRDHVAKARPSRTLGDIIDSLPFRKLGKSPVLELDPLPNDTLPELDLPQVDLAVAAAAVRR